MSKNDHKNKKDSTKRKGKNNLIENKIKFKYPTLYFLLKNGASFGVFVTIMTAAIGIIIDSIQTFIMQGYSEGLGLSHVTIKLTYFSYWLYVLFALFIILLLFIEMFVFARNKEKILDKFLFASCIFTEICFLLSILFCLFRIKSFEFVCAFGVIFVITILEMLLNKFKVLYYSIFVFATIALAGIDLDIIFLGGIILAVLFIPTMCESFKKTFFKIFPRDKNTEKMKEMDIRIEPIINMMISVFIMFFLLSAVIIYATTSINNFKKEGMGMLFNEDKNQIVEIAGLKYLLLENTDNQKLIMEITDEKTEDNINIYTVKSGEFMYLEEYDKIVVKIENCKINVNKK